MIELSQGAFRLWRKAYFRSALTGYAVLMENIRPEAADMSDATNRTVSLNPITRLGCGCFNARLGCGTKQTCCTTGAKESAAKVKVNKLPQPSPPRKC